VDSSEHRQLQMLRCWCTADRVWDLQRTCCKTDSRPWPFCV